jgi:hypothetical protein
MMSCGSCKNRRFRETYRLQYQGRKNFLRCMIQLLVTAKFVPSSLILFPLMMETRSSETSVLTSRPAPHPRRRHSSYWQCLRVRTQFHVQWKRGSVLYLGYEGEMRFSSLGVKTLRSRGLRGNLVAVSATHYIADCTQLHTQCCHHLAVLRFTVILQVAVSGTTLREFQLWKLSEG